ncbi:MAG TPA: PEP-utilizing enzyme [Actinomycetota bacterium]|nr:PEP-utilizing enzyme [Actinomycetota bacterium]
MTGTAVHRGLAAAPGRASGEARVLRSPDDALDLPRGAIVVARIIHPHLAPLFFLIGGVVVEEGALLQHATTLAREFGVPAVVGLAGATGLFRDGDRLVVDGDAGEVVLMDDRAAGAP